MFQSVCGRQERGSCSPATRRSALFYCINPSDGVFAALKYHSLNAEPPWAKLSIAESSSCNPCCRIPCSSLSSFLRINTRCTPSPSFPVSLHLQELPMVLFLPYDVVRGLQTVCPEKLAMSLTSCASPGVWPSCTSHLFLCSDCF